MATKKQVTRFTTPKGVFRYPALNKPDTKFKKEGVYKVDLVLSQEEGEALANQLQEAYQEALDAGREAFAKLPVASRKKLGSLTINGLYTIDYDKETEEPTGNLIFKFNTTASGVNAKKEPWERKLMVFDAKGNRMMKPPAIWGGTEGKVSFSFYPYFNPSQGAAGLSLRIEGVQVIKLVSNGGGASASDMGFGEEEGYEYSEGDSSDFPSDDDQYPTSDGGQDEF